MPIPTLPLAWFEFRDPAECIVEVGRSKRSWCGPAMRNGTPVTYAVELDGRRIPFKYLRHGEGGRPVLVLLHGMGITIGSFWGLGGYLFQTHDLLLVDYNSFSAPETWPAGGVSMRLLAAGVWKVIDALNLKRVSLAGSSLGGGLALLMAQMACGKDRVERLVLLNPAVYPQSLPWMYQLARIPIIGELLMAITPAERLVEGVARLGYSAPEKMPEDIKECYRCNMANVRSRWQLMDVIRHLPSNSREIAEHVAELHKVKQPVLIVWGVQERLLVEDGGRRLAKDLPQAQLIEYPDLAHLPHDEAPERIGPVVVDFLRQEAAVAATEGR